MASSESVGSPALLGRESPEDRSDDDDAVGYGKPPVHTRFRPGVSGNPAGRPKGRQTLARDLVEELQETVTLGEAAGEEGAPLRLSKQRGILRSLTAKAIAGDARATAMVLDLVQRLIGAGPVIQGAPGPAAGAPGNAWEPGAGVGPEDGSDPRERLAAKIEAMSRSLQANGKTEAEEPGAARSETAISGAVAPGGPSDPSTGSG